MIKALPIAWFVFAGLTFAASLFVASTIGLNGFTALLPGAITSVGFAVGIGLVYTFVMSLRPSDAIAILGFIHLLFQVMATVFGLAGQSVTFNPDRMGEPGILTTVGWLYGIGALADLLAGLSFIIVMIVALNTRTTASETF